MTKTTRARTLAFHRLLVVALLCGGCAGTPAFGTGFPDNRGSDIEQLRARIDAAPPRSAPPIAAAVTSAPTRLFAFDLQTRRVRWQTPLEASSAPLLAGETVVLQSGSEILGFELRSGRRRFAVDVGDMQLRGAGGEGERAAFVVGKGRGTYASSEAILVVDGTTRWRRPFESQGGSPAVRGDVVLVPWSNQYLSALDVQTGAEFARVRVRDGVISHALSARGEVFVGSHHGVTPLTTTIANGSLEQGAFLGLPQQALPGRPRLLDDLYTIDHPVPPDSARHRIDLAWQPVLSASASDSTPRPGIGLLDDNLYLIFYRFAFALDPASYRVRWVHAHPADLVGAAAQPGGLAIADETGAFLLLNAANGQRVWQQQSGLPSSVARLPAREAQSSPAAEALDQPALRAQLLSAAQDTDARLVPARLFAVDQLAAMQDAEATAGLIALCDDERLAPPVRKQACEALRDRELGADHLMAALQRHASYLAGTTAPPVGALARAAASQQLTTAVPLLIAHLKDPQTRSTDLPPLVTALRELGVPASAEPLADFLRLYHADPIDEHLVRALELIPETLVHLSGPVARPVVAEVRSDELGADSVRERARAALDTIDALETAAKAEEADKQQAQQEQAAAPSALASASASDSIPPHLSTDVVAKALLPVRDELQACLTSGDKPVFHARIVLVVEDGQVLMASVLPGELQSCIEPLIRAQTFPETKLAKKERITYVLKRH